MVALIRFGSRDIPNRPMIQNNISMRYKGRARQWALPYSTVFGPRDRCLVP